MSVVAYGIASANNYKNGPNGKSFWFYAFFLVSAIWLSAKVFVSGMATVITGIVLTFGNILFWEIIWWFKRSIKFHNGMTPEIMITKIGHYELGKIVSETKGLKEFTDEEYISFASAGAPRTLSDEKIYEGDDVEFNGDTWQVTVGANKGLIYNISLQIVDSEGIDQIFITTLKYLMKEMGKYNEHPIFSKKYVWIQEEGSVTFTIAKAMGHKGITLIFTSSSIDDEVAKSLGM
jgi:hypothetical protein